MLILKQKEKHARASKEKQRKEKWNTLLGPHMNDNSEQLAKTTRDRISKARQKEKKQARDYVQWKKKMQERVDSRPLLVEAEDRAEAETRARKKALEAVKQSLLDSGIKNYKNFFSAEELDDLGVF